MSDDLTAAGAAKCPHRWQPSKTDAEGTCYEYACWRCGGTKRTLYGDALARAESAARVAALEALLARAIESLHDAERELHVWVDRDRERHPGWSDVGYEPWNNKPSLALWSVEVIEIERDARALATPPAPIPSEPVGRFTDQDEWPCVCGHVKRRHHFGDTPAIDGSFGAWCQADPMHCIRFRPSTPATRDE